MRVTDAGGTNLVEIDMLVTADAITEVPAIGIRPMASGQVRLRLAITSESCCTWAGSASRARAT
ncbi:hypothetical protein [Rhodococcus sp. IEGM 1318]|uniref:hypothetical protein n=1 Tax=Rhodococcus sp. IEGM 1318 TaxID=3082226 RepID=UPI002953551F|nr:hypothetical protein [Rhodococcus sp. IEGM 1318]MDV8009503.1 hypothetical protein [Rhodococcus sp. IEGM 1318]